MPLPRAMPMTPPTAGEDHRLDQELEQDLGAAGADGLAHADLAGPLGDRDGHDRHHADAADHQRDRRDDDERQQHRLRDLVPHLRMASWVTRSKSLGLSSVRPWRMRMIASTSRIASSRSTPLVRHHRDHRRGGAERAAADALVAELLAEGRVRHDGEVVGARPEPADRRPLVDHARSPCSARRRRAPACPPGRVPWAGTALRTDRSRDRHVAAAHRPPAGSSTRPSRILAKLTSTNASLAPMITCGTVRSLPWKIRSIRGGGPPVPSQVSTSADRRRQPLDGLAVLDGEPRPLDQVDERGARREADRAEPLRRRSSAARASGSNRAATCRSRG